VELHKFRKTFATFHHEHGISVRTLQNWLGHSDLETTMAYLKGSDAASEHSQAQVAASYESLCVI
jgi:integrase/recombinase XerD